MVDPNANMTVALNQAREGDRDAAEALYARIYEELHGLAGGVIGRGVGGQTLQATALVNEAWMRLAGQASPWESRGHFFSVAAKAMRSILVDHARKRRAQKRGGAKAAVTLDDALAVFESNAVDLVALDEALETLAAEDPRKSRLVELRFFTGLTIPEAAEVMGVSHATLERDWVFTRAWLKRALTAD